jgi:arylsulfatase
MTAAPNILLIMTDQQRWDTLRCYGYDHMITPNVDALAARGVAFSHAFVQGAVCGPSRNSIVSSQYVHTHGVYGNEQWLRPDQPNWIESLRLGGYHTANIGKMHTAPIRLAAGFEHRLVVENKNYLQGHHGPDADDYDLFLAGHGFKRPAPTYYQDIDDWPDRLQATTWPHDDELYPDNYVGQQTVDYLQACAFDKPLFMWCGFSGPHDPYDVTADFLAMYDDVDVPDPVGFDGELDSKPPPQQAAMAGMEGRHSAAAVWWSRATPERIRRMRKHYYANVTLMDHWVGKMVSALDQRGQLDNTIILFTSDHGDCLGDHHQVYKFSSHYDSVARVPLVVAGPGVERLGVRGPLVEAIDLGPTFLAMAGLEPLAGASGKSLQPLLAGAETELRDCVFSEHGARVMARTQEWKLVLYLGESYGELYDLRSDPEELHNRYDDAEAGTARSDMVERTMHWYGTTRMQR